jgi:hypothetical protein
VENARDMAWTSTHLSEHIKMRTDLLFFVLQAGLCLATNSTGEAEDEGITVGTWAGIIGGTLCFLGIAGGSYWYFVERPKTAGAASVTENDSQETPAPAASSVAVALPLMPTARP